MKKKEFKLPDQKAAGMRHRSNDAVQHLKFEMDEKYKDFAIGKKYFVRTYGCQANVRDGETLRGLLEEMGFTSCLKEEDADVLIYNTCAVRKAAEQHVLGEIGWMKSWKRKNPERIIAVCGCMAQEEDTVNEIIERFRQVDLIFGTHNIDRFPYLLHRCMKNHERVVEVYSKEGNVIEGLPCKRDHDYKAFVNIMYGCNKFCTYCIVPYTRGRERSRSMEDIMEEVNDLVSKGVKEITLLGQNVNAYGDDLGMEDGFTKLLVAVAKTNVPRIRFYSSHPRNYSHTTIEAMRDYPNICPSLHLAVQSGSDEVLKRMNRGYTAKEFMDLIDEMKVNIPHLELSTDIIVGFPHETREQFEETLKLVDYCQFDLAYTFVYSPREGTPASRMEDDIPLEEKKARLHELNEHIRLSSKANNRKYDGKVLTVLCDGISRRNDEAYTGYSHENKLVNFTGENIHAGDLVKVKIVDAMNYSLNGVKVEE